MSLARPILVIIGATGTGKTKLAVEMCLKYAGEVISTDSMQVYKGLDIATNKATAAEMKGVPHHMIRILPPLHMGFNVIEFRDRALNILEDIWRRKKLPVLIGGTSYYVEGILWNILLSESMQNPDSECPKGNDFKDLPSYFAMDSEFLKMPAENLYEKLKEVDAVMAQTVHPNNYRQILRALQVYSKTGKKKSDLINEQMSAEGGSVHGGSLRFKNTCMLWLSCPRIILESRLDARIDQMATEGLREEVTAFFDQNFSDYQEKLAAISEQVGEKEFLGLAGPKGIFQSIALKEFLPYLSLSGDERKSNVGDELFSKGLEQLKLATRQYSKKQNRWVVNRLLRPKDRQVPPVYELDTSRPEFWKSDVLKKATLIVESFLSESDCPIIPTKAQPDPYSANRNDVNFCEACNLATSGLQQWKIHQQSRKHRNRIFYLKKKKEYELLKGQLDLRRLQLGGNLKRLCDSPEMENCEADRTWTSDSEGEESAFVLFEQQNTK